MFRAMAKTAGPLSRLQRLGRERRGLLMEAASALALACVAVAFLPFRRAIRLGSVAPAPGRSGSVSDCAWAVEAAARRMPLRAVCIQKGLALQRMLRRRGFDAKLHYGARNEPRPGKLHAHVWVSVDGEVVMGGSERPDFAELAVFP
jgi:hypothetical protein